MAFHDAMHSTIHSDGCEILVSPQSKLTSKGHRCHMCGKYRHTLNRMLFRAERSDGLDSDRSHPQNHTNYQFLSTPEEIRRLQRMHQDSRTVRKQVEHLRVRLERATEERGTTVNQDLHSNLTHIVADNSHVVANSYPPGSFGRTFWESQE